MKAIVIEQDQGDTKLAFEVHQNAAIDRIRLARATVESQAIGEGSGAPIAVMFDFDSRSLNAPPNILRIEIEFRMAGVEEVEGAAKDKPSKKRKEATKREALVRVECDYEVDYALREGFDLTPQHVKAFKDGNAIFNAWPYFREYLQNNLQRMGLPPLTAPFLRLQPKLMPRGREKYKHEGGEDGSRRNRQEGSRHQHRRG